MITAFTVKNFKAIGDEPVRIELKPITLLFGANSAGKSSILHALQYAHEVFNNRNFNADKITPGENNSLDLGGFKRFIHNNDTNRSLVINFELNFTVDMIPRDFYNHSFRVAGYSGMEEVYESAQMFEPTKLLSGETVAATTAYVEAEVSWNDKKQRPYIRRYETGINGERIAIIYADINSNKIAVRYLNTSHPIFSDLWIEHGISLDGLVEKCVKNGLYELKLEDQEKFDVKFSPCKTSEIRRDKFKLLGRVPSSAFTLSSNINNINFGLPNQPNALPLNWDDKLIFNEFWRDDYEISDNYNIAIIARHGTVKLLSTVLSIALEDLLSCLLVAPGRAVAKWLESMVCIGPLREIPPRNFTVDRIQPRRWRWATGLAAWDWFYLVGQLQLEPSQKPYEDIRAWLKENFEEHYYDITRSVLSDPSYKVDFNKYLDDLPDAALFKAQSQKSQKSQKSNKDIHAWLKENFEKYLNNLPADVLVNLNLPRKSSSQREDAGRLLYRINDWLASDQRLNTGYKVIIERFREISSVFFKDFDEDKSQENVLMLLKEILNEPEIIRIWLHDISRNINLKPHEIGTGISQVLPIVVAAVGVYAPLVVIEQPELHIHPALQVRLGDLFIENRLGILFIENIINEEIYEKSFLIETHSEHLLLRLMRRIREGKIKPDDVNVIFAEPMEHGSRFIKLRLDKEGDFIDEWPGGFFEESFQEKFAGR